MPLIPAAPLEMQGRFAPFSSPDQIVSGTWRTPKDWPEARKAATVEDLETRMLYIVSSDDEIKSYRMAVRECSRLLNGMFGGGVQMATERRRRAVGLPTRNHARK